MSHPFTDIVIPVHGALADLRECINTLKAHTVDYRLLFVDDASDRETSNYLYDVCLENPSWLLVRTSRQRWFTRASNLGLKLVRTERSVLLNSDCVLDKGWLEELFSVWDTFQAENPQRRIGLVGSVMSMEDPRRYEDTVKPGYVTGHCWLVSISALYEISAARGMPGWYLDEIKPMTAHIGSDRDGCWELQQLGFATLTSYKSAVGHKGGKSWGYNLGAIPRNPGAVDLDMNR
jgi:glycosyltransferase involved in cell wall biosynthesis